MRIFSSATLRKSLCWLVLAAAVTLRGQDAGNAGDRDSISHFVNSVAQTVYKMAWPTATYRDFSLDGIEPIEGGLNVLVTLNGLSGLDQSDLWVQLVFVIRNGGLDDVRVKNDNHILVAPFATTTALAGAAAEMAKEYAAQQQAAPVTPSHDSPRDSSLPDPYPTPHFNPPSAPRPTPPVAQETAPTPPPAPKPATPTTPPPTGTIAAEATCLINSTGHALTFDYRWGILKWIKYELPPNQEVKIWWPTRDGPGPSPPLTIRYDDDFAPGYTERGYVLLRTPTALPVDCSNVQNYRFTLTGSKIAVDPVSQ